MPPVLSGDAAVSWCDAACAGREPQDQPLLCCLDRRLGISPDRLAAWEASLSPAEHKRRAAYRLAGDRERFLLARGWLRALLGRWLNRSAAEVVIELGRHGKPHCPGGPQFNLSHSGDLILLAVHPSRPVGVDVEQHRPALDWPPIAQRVFAKAQLEALMHVPPTEQAQAFLHGWCLLEARLKAGGQGFAGLGAPSPSHPPPRCWTVALPAGYGGALALFSSRG